MKTRITAIITATIALVLLIAITASSQTNEQSGEPNSSQLEVPISQDGPSSASLLRPGGGVGGGADYAHYAIIVAKTGGSTISNGDIWICVAILGGVAVAAIAFTVVLLAKNKKTVKDGLDSEDESKQDEP